MKLIIGLFFAFLVLLPFGQLNQLPLAWIIGPDLAVKVPEVHVYLNELVLGLLLLCWAVWRLIFLKKKYQLPPLGKPMLLFLLVAGLSLLFNSPLLLTREVAVASLYWLRLSAYFGLYFLIFDLKNQSSSFNPKQILGFLTVIGVYIAVFGLVQYWLWPDLSALKIFEWDPHYYRIAGPFLDPGFSGIVYVLCLILLVVTNWSKLSILTKKNLGFYGLVLVVYFALALTYSRSSYLAFLIAMGVVALVKKKPKFFLIVFLITVLTLLALPRVSGGEGVKLERTASIQSRFGSWQEALRIFLQKPLWGIGFNAYRYRQQDLSFKSHAAAAPDSSLLFVLATTGIIGFLAYFWLGLTAIRLALAKLKSKLGLLVLASITALIGHSFFLNSLFYPIVLTWLAFILALL